MKLILMAILLAMVGCSSPNRSGSSAGSGLETSTPDKLAEAVFKTFVSNDSRRFRAIAIPPKELMRPIAEKNLRERSGFDAEKIRNKMNSFDADYEKRAGEIEDSWIRTRETADKAGVIWESARFERAEYRVQVRGEPERKTAGIMMIFNVGGTEFSIYLDDCFELNGSWYCADNLSWRGENDKDKK